MLSSSVGWLLPFHFRLVFGVKRLAAPLGGFGGYSVLREPLGEVRVLAGQMMRDESRDVFILDHCAWEVGQLRMDIQLIIHRENPRLLEINGIVDESDDRQVIAVPHDVFSRLHLL